MIGYRRASRLTLTLVVAGAVLAGCTTKPPAAPPSAATSLAASPAASSAASSAAPPTAAAVGVCSSTYTTTYAFDTVTGLTVDELHPVADCGARHLTETFHVGTFTGADAAPPAGAGRQAAYAECEQRAAEFLGADWHDGRLALLLLPPSATQWTAGTRAFRCDLVELRGVLGDALPRTGSLKDALRGARPVAIGCGTAEFNTNKTPRRLVPAACDQEHNAEYVGSFRAPAGTAPGTDKPFLDGCQQAAAAYVQQPLADLARRKDSGITWWRVSVTNWDAGERSARCVVIFHRPVTKSLHNLGSGAL